MLLYVFLVLFVCAVYFWSTRNYNYWKNRNVPHSKPKFLVGDIGLVLIMKKSLSDIITEMYSHFDGYPYVGFFNGRNPALIIRDLDIVKDVLVKEFNKFHDIPIVLNEDKDPVLAKNPFFIKGEKWKIVRGQLTPLLTVSKTKVMLPLVQQTCENLVKYLSENPAATGQDGIEAKELALKFTTDNVASCAFGLEGKSFDDPNAEFRKMIESFVKPTLLTFVRFLLMTVFPDLAKVLNISMGSKEVSDKLKKIIMETIKYRQDHNVVRNDFLDSIIELKSKEISFEYTEDHMVAHCLTFFLDGSETSAIVFNFAMFELAANPDIQDKLKQEVESVLAKHKTMTFEAIQEMSYLDAVFQETLRKYPSLLIIMRECTEQFTILQRNGEKLVVEKGTSVYIPVFAIHRDSQHYNDPERFDPDRFTPEAKHPLPKNAFFGFGDGPRICLGQRFANMQIKAGLATVVANFELRLNSKTRTPLTFESVTFMLNAKGGIWLNFYKRNK